MQSMIHIFAKIEDPRVERSKQHKLVDIITIGICATISGAEGFNEMEDWGNAKQKWLRKFLELPHGIPTHDTFNRVFSALHPLRFQEAFLEWMESVNMLLDHKFISIDGKTVRRSYDKLKNKNALHLVSAWASDAHVSLGQVQVDEKSNEITAIPALLNILEISGAIITLDAMGTQKDIAKQIVNKNADYVLSLKKNHGTLYDDAGTYFQYEKDDQFIEYKTIEKDHGRIESRVYKAIKNIAWLQQKNEWDNLQTIVQVTATRETIIGKQTSTLYFLTSIAAVHIDLIHNAIRKHWSIENSLHWSLDVIFKEDQSRLRNNNAAQNVALLRKMAISILKKDSSKNISLKRKRFSAGLDDSYLLNLLNIRPI